MSHRIDNLPNVFNLPFKPNFACELDLQKQGFLYIAGVDEVGRGPLAGPVVTAAVILDKNRIPDGLNDSKNFLPRDVMSFIMKFCKVL